LASSSLIPSWLRGLTRKTTTIALRMARPLAIQNGPVLPLAELEPPKSSVIRGKTEVKKDTFSASVE
jgi:hypothetical protein